MSGVRIPLGAKKENINKNGETAVFLYLLTIAIAYAVDVYTFIYTNIYTYVHTILQSCYAQETAAYF